MPVTPADPAILIDRHFSVSPPAAIGVAVSGGSDSLALLCLAADWARANGVALHAATVDHGLRSEAQDEARHVAAICHELGLPHEILIWADRSGTGNLQAEARKARYALLAGWARDHDLGEVLVGHTIDDQAETFLIRLARKSGVEGLASMDARFERDGQLFGRPLLTATRESLRDNLRNRGVDWCEDASNADPVYDRVRARRALGHLGPLGLTAETLAAVTDNLASARDALDQFTRASARDCCNVDRGDVLFQCNAFFALPDEITHRLLGSALQWISGSQYPPRADAIATLRASLQAGKAMTLGGCFAMVKGDDIRITREAGAVQSTVSDSPTWDRWQIAGDWRNGMQIRALSETDLTALPDWRDSGLPRASLLSSPALWYNETLIAAPLAEFSQGYSANLLPNRANLPLLAD